MLVAENKGFLIADIMQLIIILKPRRIVSPVYLFIYNELENFEGDS